MIDFGKQSWIFPMPVLIIGTYDENLQSDMMNAAWGGIHDTNEIGICLSSSHKTTKNILFQREFTVSFATAEEVAAADYVGLVSANDQPNKMEKTNWHIESAMHVNAPRVKELPVYLECSLKNYDENSGYLVATIDHVIADDAVVNQEGKIDFEKFHPIAFREITNEYVTFGNSVGKAYHDGKKMM